MHTNLSNSERVPTSWEDGYVWMKKPAIPKSKQKRLEEAWEVPEDSRHWSALLSPETLRDYGWVWGSSSTDPGADMPTSAPSEVATIAELGIHYRSRTTSLIGVSSGSVQLESWVEVLTTSGLGSSTATISPGLGP